MSARQAKLSLGRPLELQTANIAAEPQDGYADSFGPDPLTDPHHIISPRTSTGMYTTGIMIGLTAGLGHATPVAGGFELVLWVANPVGYFWYRSTSVFLQSRDAAVTFDIDAFPIYLQIVASSVAVAGSIRFNLMEQ
jgi:hypothetical protein